MESSRPRRRSLRTGIKRGRRTVTPLELKAQPISGSLRIGEGDPEVEEAAEGEEVGEVDIMEEKAEEEGITEGKEEEEVIKEDMGTIKVMGDTRISRKIGMKDTRREDIEVGTLVGVVGEEVDTEEGEDKVAGEVMGDKEDMEARVDMGDMVEMEEMGDTVRGISKREGKKEERTTSISPEGEEATIIMETPLVTEPEEETEEATEGSRTEMRIQPEGLPKESELKDAIEPFF